METEEQGVWAGKGLGRDNPRNGVSRCHPWHREGTAVTPRADEPPAKRFPHLTSYKILGTARGQQ